MKTYAVVEIGSKQYRVEEGEKILVDRLPQEEGDKVAPRAIMYRPDKGEPIISGDELEKIKVDAVVDGHLRGKKIRVFKYRPKKGYRRRAGHRSELTRLEIKKIKLMSRKPAAKTTDPKPEESKVEKPAKAVAAKKKVTVKKKTAKKSKKEK